MSIGSGGFGGGWHQPSGPYGPWGGCGCSGCLIVIAGVILVFAGLFRTAGF
jgi:hypothetical protein